MEPATQAEVVAPSAKEEGAFSFSQRVSLWFISLIGFVAIRLICATMRYEVSCESETEVPPEKMPPPRSIAPFWHNSVFSATYYFRRRGVSVMTSRSFDGEYIARIIESFGFKPVRGSSTRGGVRALLGMHDIVESGGVAAFTIDGPRGPKYVAKPGPVLLSRNTGAPIYCFYVAVSSAWIVKSWDAFMIPRPFAKAHIRWSRAISVPPGADSEHMKLLHAEMQQALERVRMYAEAQVQK